VTRTCQNADAGRAQFGALVGTALGALAPLGWAAHAAPHAGPSGRPPPQVLPLEARWCAPDGSCLDLEVADTLEEQRWGLMLRPPMLRGRGMWFPFATPRRARFWMHRTPASLDMVFVRRGRIVAIEHAARPCLALPCPSYGPTELVDGVLELGAGEARRIGLAAGDRLKPQPLKPPRSP